MRAEPHVGCLAVLAHLSILVSVLIRSLRHPLNVVGVPHVLEGIPPLQDFFLQELMCEGAVQLMACEFVELHVQYRRSSVVVDLVVGVPLVLLLPFLVTLLPASGVVACLTMYGAPIETCESSMARGYIV